MNFIHYFLRGLRRKDCRPSMAIKLVHENPPSASDPDLLNDAIEAIKTMRERRVMGFAIAYVTQEGVEYLRHITEECVPEELLSGVIVIGKEIVEDYDIDDFNIGDYIEQ